MSTTEKPAQAVPMVHMNGDTRDALLKPHMAVLSALRDLEAKLAATAPNRRNFYCKPVDDFPLAQEQHRARMAMVQQMMDEHGQIAESLI